MGKKRRWFNFSYTTYSHLYLFGVCLSFFAYAFILPRFLFSNLQSNILGWNQMIKKILCLNAEEAHELDCQACELSRAVCVKRELKQYHRRVGPPLIFLGCRSES